MALARMSRRSDMKFRKKQKNIDEHPERSAGSAFRRPGWGQYRPMIPAAPAISNWLTAMKIRRNQATVVLFVTLAACASVKQVDQNSISVPQLAAPIIGARGPLTIGQSKALLQRIGTGPGEADILKRHLAIEEAIAESPLIAGNVTRLLTDGGETFPAMFSAIKQARQSINLEYYIFEDIKSGGESLGDLLIETRQEGVAVNIIYDSYGSDSTAADSLKRLAAANITLVEFNTINPLDSKGEYSLNDRDHRKMLVVDGARAIVAGINLSTTYQSSSLGKSGNGKNQAGEYWRDTDLQIDGPVVAQLQSLFIQHWSQQKGPPLATDRKSTRLNSSHMSISYAVFCLKKKK